MVTTVYCKVKVIRYILSALLRADGGTVWSETSYLEFNVIQSVSSLQ